MDSSRNKKRGYEDEGKEDVPGSKKSKLPALAGFVLLNLLVFNLWG